MAENGVRYVPGDWNAVCDVCAQKYKASQMKKRWDGLMVCPHDWEPRHPQDFLRAVPDRQAVPWTRPETPDDFIFVCYYPLSSGQADIGVADCAMADIMLPSIPSAPSVPTGTGPFLSPPPGVDLQLQPEQGDSQINFNQTDNFDING